MTNVIPKRSFPLMASSVSVPRSADVASEHRRVRYVDDTRHDSPGISRCTRSDRHLPDEGRVSVEMDVSVARWIPLHRPCVVRSPLIVRAGTRDIRNRKTTHPTHRHT